MRFDDIDLLDPLADHDLNVGLLGFWLALESTAGGSVWYDLCGRSHAAIQGSTGSSPAVTWGSDDDRGVYGLSSSTSQNNIPWVLVPTNPTLNSLGTGPGTILGRFRTTSHNQNERIICFGSNTTWQYFYNSSPQKMALFNGGNVYSSNTTPTLNEWHTGGYSYAGGNAAFYWDGQPDGTAAPGSMASASGLDLNIGSDVVAGTLDYLLGDLAWVAIWNRELSAHEHWQWEEESRFGFPSVVRRSPRRLRAYLAASPPPPNCGSSLAGCGFLPAMVRVALGN